MRRLSLTLNKYSQKRKNLFALLFSFSIHRDAESANFYLSNNKHLRTALLALFFIRLESGKTVFRGLYNAGSISISGRFGHPH